MRESFRSDSPEAEVRSPSPKTVQVRAIESREGVVVDDSKSTHELTLQLAQEDLALKKGRFDEARRKLEAAQREFAAAGAQYEEAWTTAQKAHENASHIGCFGADSGVAHGPREFAHLHSRTGDRNRVVSDPQTARPSSAELPGGSGYNSSSAARADTRPGERRAAFFTPVAEDRPSQVSRRQGGSGDDGEMQGRVPRPNATRFNAASALLGSLADRILS